MHIFEITKHRVRFIDIPDPMLQLNYIIDPLFVHTANLLSDDIFTILIPS